MRNWTWGVALASCALSLLTGRSAEAQNTYQVPPRSNARSSGYYQQSPQMPASYGQDGSEQYSDYAPEQGYEPTADCQDGSCGTGDCGNGNCGPGSHGGDSCHSGHFHARKTPLECDAENIWRLFSCFNEHSD